MATAGIQKLKDNWDPSWKHAPPASVGEALRSGSVGEAAHVAKEKLQHGASSLGDAARAALAGAKATVKEAVGSRVEGAVASGVDTAKELAHKAGTLGDTARKGAHAAAEAAAHAGDAARSAAAHAGDAARAAAAKAGNVATDTIEAVRTGAMHAAKEGKDAVIHGGEKAAQFARSGAEAVKAGAIDWAKAPLEWAEANLLHQGVGMQLTRALSLTFTMQFLFGFLPHLLFGISKHRTALAGVNFLALALFSFLTSPNWSLRQLLLTGCCCLWATRLFAYILTRNKDSGLHLKGRPGAKAVAWSVQAAYIFLSMLPIILANADAPSVREAPSRYFTLNTRWGNIRLPVASWLPSFMQPAAPSALKSLLATDTIGVLEIMGFAMFGIGFALEIISDITRSRHKGPLPVMSGVYSIVRYPQYLGEIVLWTGLALAALRGHSGYRWLSLLSPLAVAFTTIFVSGLPVAERNLAKKYSDNDEYQAWRKKTPALIPHVY